MRIVLWKILTTKVVMGPKGLLIIDAFLFTSKNNTAKIAVILSEIA